MVLDRSGSFEFVGVVQWGSACGKGADAYVNVRGKKLSAFASIRRDKGHLPLG